MGRENRIKVVYVYKDFDVFNGLIRTFLILAKRRKELRFDFKVCVFRDPASAFAEKFRADGGTLDSLGSASEDSPLIIWKMYRYLKRERPDIVHTFILKPNLYGRIAALAAGVPVIISNELTLRNQAPTPLRRLRDRFLHPLNGYLNRFTDHIICRSEPMRREWETPGLKEKMSVIPAPFDVELSRSIPGSELREAASGTREWVIGIVARLTEEKRHCDLLEAFAEVARTFDHCKLLIVGDGDKRGQLEALAKQKGIERKVEFAGFQENVSPYLSRMDLFVLPSRTEGTPLTIFEAMACGLPVVATNVGGVPDIVQQSETGLIVEPGRPSELARAIKQMLSEPAKMRTMGRKGKERVLRDFHPDNFIRKHEALYERSLGNRGAHQLDCPVAGRR